MFTNVEATTMRNGRCMLSKVLQSFFMVINFDGYLDSVLYIYMLLLTLLLFCLNFFPSSFQCSMFMLLNRSFQKYGVRKLCFNVFTSPGKEYLNFLSLHCMFIFTPSLYSTLMIKWLIGHHFLNHSLARMVFMKKNTKQRRFQQTITFCVYDTPKHNVIVA